MKNKLVVSILIALALAVSACGAVATSTPTAAVPITGGSTGAANVMAGQDTSMGAPFLVDSQGKTLYLYLNDQPGTSNCYDTCAQNWPPLLTTGSPVAGTGANASMLGTTTRTDGSVQVTYNGHPLYYYAGDSAAGDVNGEGKLSLWYVITPDGMQE